jgi:hypothetical protein
MPRRLFVLSRTDLGRFSELLVEAFPDMWFVPTISIAEERAADPPTVRATQSLVDLYDDPDPFHHRCRIVFGSAWQPHWEQDKSGWTLANRAYPDGELELSGYQAGPNARLSVISRMGFSAPRLTASGRFEDQPVSIGSFMSISPRRRSRGPCRRLFLEGRWAGAAVESVWSTLSHRSTTPVATALRAC